MTTRLIPSLACSAIGSEMICPRTVFQRISASFGILNNLFLIFLIIAKSPKKLGNYKYLMIYISVFEILYAVLDGLIVPRMFSEGSAALVLTHVREAWLPYDLLLPANVLYCTFFGASMAVFAIHFIYRYLVVSGSWYLASHDLKVITSLLLFPLIFGLFWTVLSYFSFGPFPEADLFLERDYLPSNELTLSDVSYVGLYFYPVDVHGTEYTGWKTIIGFSLQGIFITLSSVLIFCFGYKCHQYTKGLSNTAIHSVSYRNLQSQLFYALVFQTIIPVFLMHIPCSASFGAAFFNISIEFVSQVLSCTISLFPALDPLPSLFIIKNYRMAIYDICKGLFNRITCKGKQPEVQFVESRTDIKITQKSKISVF